MANARDIIPIALAGLGGLLGGRPTAGAITNAAQISRAGRLDKQREEQLAVSNARSARQLELAEKASERSQKGVNLAESRESRYRADQDARTKAREEAQARVEASKKEWIEGHPEADEQDLYGLSLMTTPREVYLFDKDWAERNSMPTIEEGKALAEGLEPGQSISFKLANGATMRVSGVADGNGRTISARHIQNSIDDGLDDYNEAVNKAKMDYVRYQDESDKMREGRTAGATREDHERLKEQQRLKFHLDRLQAPGGEWRFIEDKLDRLGMGDEGIANTQSAYQQALAAQAEQRAQPAPAAAGDPAVDAAYEALFGGGGEAPPLMPSHTARAIAAPLPAQAPITPRNTMIRGR